MIPDTTAKVEPKPCPLCGEAMQKIEGPGGLPPGFVHPCPPPTKLNPPCLLRNSVFSDCDLAAWNIRPAPEASADAPTEAMVRNAYEEGVEDGIEWGSGGDMDGPAPQWIDSVARAELLKRAAAPIAPVQDDDAEWPDERLIFHLREVAKGAVPFRLAQDKAADRIARLSTAEHSLVEALDELQKAEAAYRYAHDILGTGDPKTGRAWDLMKRAGDDARAALASTANPTGETGT